MPTMPGVNAVRNIANTAVPITPTNITKMSGNGNLNNFWTDLGDFIGWGTARREREYNTAMANSQYQRAVADMKAAGLNPTQMFASGAGQPASIGAGYGHAANATMGGLAGTLTGIANVAHTFNNDKIKNNNMSQKNAINFLHTAAKIMKLFN